MPLSDENFLWFINSMSTKKIKQYCVRLNGARSNDVQVVSVKIHAYARNKTSREGNFLIALFFLG